MLVDLMRLYLLLYRGSSQCQDLGPLQVATSFVFLELIWLIVSIEEVSHYQIVEVLLVRMMSFIKY